MVPAASRTGHRGMVAAADQLAASAGVAALDLGGNAADAIVAAAAVMAVTGPHLCGLGGDMLAMISQPGLEPQALLSAGRAGSGADPAALRAEGHSVMPLRGDIRTVPVPGAVDGWLALHERYGRLPIATVLSRAIELAEEGFTASLLLVLASHLVADVPGAELLCPDGPLTLDQVVRLPHIARTLRAIADHGRAGFYGGEFGRQLLALGHGFYQPDDLEHSQADWCTPLRLRVWGHDLWTVPPPSQGYLTLAGAWVAEQAGLSADPSDPSWAHLLIEAARAVGHDRPEVLFDGADGPALLDDARLRSAADRIRADRAAPNDVAHPDRDRDRDPDRIVASATVPRIGDGDTTHLCAVDADGFGISLTQSNALDFGSHLVAGTTGIFLHNRGLGFSLEPGHPAELTPGRRPPHTLSPMLVTGTDGSLTHLVGAMGGDGQPQIILQLLARMLVAGQDPSTAIAAARYTLEAPSAGPFRLWWGEDLTVMLEAQAPAHWITTLTELGHRVQPISAYDPTAVGCAQIITVQRDADGRPTHFTGASDPRSPEGAAVVR
jgi:gamma-glutamyltranspeptidase / glutathione hydrolase